MKVYVNSIYILMSSRADDKNDIEEGVSMTDVKPKVSSTVPKAPAPKAPVAAPKAPAPKAPAPKATAPKAPALFGMYFDSFLQQNQSNQNVHIQKHTRYGWTFEHKDKDYYKHH